LSRNRSDCKLALEAIRKACQTFQIESVIAFGKKPVDSPIGLPVKNVGMLSAIEMAALLMESRIGYLDYFDGYLAKSGIFAAYCAHGLVPLLLRNNHSEADGLEPGKHFWTATALPSETGVVAQRSVADHVRKWYGRHSVTWTARTFADKLKSNVNLLVEA